MKKKVLIVEDDPVSQKLLQAICEKHNFSVDIAPNGAVGLLYLLRDGGYSLIISDLMMPEIPGETFLAVTEALVNRGLLNKTNILIVSSVTEYAHLSKLAESCCVQAVIPKPIDAATLSNQIIKVLNEPEARVAA